MLIRCFYNVLKNNFQTICLIKPSFVLQQLFVKINANLSFEYSRIKGGWNFVRLGGGVGKGLDILITKRKVMLFMVSS